MGTMPALLMLTAILLVTFGALLGYAWRGAENVAIREQAHRRHAMAPVRAVATVVDAELVDEYAIEGVAR